MKAILLAAGLGTRLRPLTETVPKCLVSIGGRPLLDIWLQSLSEVGFGPFLVNTHYLAKEVSGYVEHSPYRRDVTLVHEPTLLGTGGTLLANRWFAGRAPLLLAHADNLCLCDFRAFVRAHEERPTGSVMTMMTFLTDEPESCGIVEVDERRILVAFHEKVHKPPTSLANAAVYIVEPEVVDFLETLQRPTIDFSTEVVPRFVKRIYTWQNTGIHRDIGTPASLKAAQSAASARNSHA